LAPLHHDTASLTGADAAAASLVADLAFGDGLTRVAGGFRRCGAAADLTFTLRAPLNATELRLDLALSSAQRPAVTVAALTSSDGSPIALPVHVMAPNRFALTVRLDAPVVGIRLTIHDACVFDIDTLSLAPTVGRASGVPPRIVGPLALPAAPEDAPNGPAGTGAAPVALDAGWQILRIEGTDAPAPRLSVHGGPTVAVPIHQTAPGRAEAVVLLPAGGATVDAGAPDSASTETVVSAIPLPEPPPLQDVIPLAETGAAVLALPLPSRSAPLPALADGLRAVAGEATSVIGDYVFVHGIDGYLTLAFDRPLKAGWYELVADIVSEQVIRPRLFAEDTRSPPDWPGWVMRRRADGRFAVTAKVVGRVGRLHVRLNDVPVSARIAAFTIERITFERLARAWLETAARLSRTDRRRFRRFLIDTAKEPFRRKAVSFDKSGGSLPGADALAPAYRLWLTRREPVDPIALTFPDGRRRILPRQTATASARRLTIVRCGATDDAPVAATLSAAATVAEAAGVFQRRAAENGTTHGLLLPEADALAAEAETTVATILAAGEDDTLLVFDDDVLDESGARTSPRFGAAFDPDRVRSAGAAGGPVVFPITMLAALRHPDAPATTLDLQLALLAAETGRGAVHVARVLVHRRAGAMAEGDRRPLVAAHVAAVFAGDRAAPIVTPVAGGRGFRIDRQPPDRPLASLIVCTRDRADLLERFFTTLDANTHYRPFEVILLDHRTHDPAAIAVIETARARSDTTVLRDDGPFNFAALNNRAAAAAQGAVLVFLNNDLAFRAPGWLDALVVEAMRPAVGCVGAKLVFPDGRLQHGGVIVAPDGRTVHADTGLPAGAGGSGERLFHVHRVTAVTGACMAVRRSVFEAAGGFDAQSFWVAYNDIDLCLRLQARGLVTLWTPHAEVVHDESATRGRDLSPAQQDRQLRERLALVRRHRTSLAQNGLFPFNAASDTAHRLPRA